MKRIMFIFSLLFISIIILNGCKNTETYNNHLSTNNYLSTFKSYKVELDNLIEERMEPTELVSLNKYQLRYLNKLNESYKYTYEELLEIYNKQNGLQYKADSLEYLIGYRNLMDKVIFELEEESVEQLDVFIEISSDQFGDTKIYCGYSENGEIILKLIYDYEGITISTSFKFGYNDDNLYINQMNYYRNGTDINYYYSEFYENVYYMHLSYEDETNFQYMYLSETENEKFLFRKGDDVIEGVQNVYSGYYLRWYDEPNKKRYTIKFSNQGELLSEYYEIFNQKGLVFDYVDYDTTTQDN